MARCVEVKQVGNVTVATIMIARVTHENDIQDLGEVLFSFADERHPMVLLNFEKVTFMSSAALGKIITMDKRMKANRAQFKLCGMAQTPDVRGAFEITRIDKFVTILDGKSLEEAIASFT